jgi:hypothetical protein
MNLIDLRDELHARSRPGDDVLGVVRLAGVRNRVRSIRQRRIATGGATTLIVIVAIITGYGLIGRGPAAQLPAATDVLVNGFPQYAVGALLVETHTVALVDGEIGMTTTATDLGFAFTQRCVVSGVDDPMVLWSVGLREVGGFSCDREGGTYYMVSGAAWSALGIPAGDTVRITAKLLGTTVGGDPIDLRKGTFAAALMRRVPFEEYPLPRRPDILAPLTAGYDDQDRTELVSQQNDPVSLSWTGPLDLTLVAQTPGSIEVARNGTAVCTAEWWDYAGGVQRCRSDDSGPATISFSPTHMTGEWRAAFGPP